MPWLVRRRNSNRWFLRIQVMQKSFPNSQPSRTRIGFSEVWIWPQRASSVRAYLGREFNDYWIGRQGPIEWPARSPGMSLCDFFLKYIKGKVCIEPFHSLEELKRRITDEWRRMWPETLRKVWENTELLLNYLSNTNGGHIDGLFY